MIGDALGALAKALNEAGIRWYLFGAQAGILYGVPRLTADVDATADYPIERADELVRLLGGAGFQARVGDVATFVRRTRVIPLTHAPSGIPVDLVLAGVGLEQEFLGRVRLMDLDGVAVSVIAPDDLIVTKVLAGRPKDLEDVQAVLTQQAGALDLDRVRRILGALDRALDRADLVASLENLVEASRREGPAR